MEATGVSELSEGMPANTPNYVIEHTEYEGQLVIKASNEGGYNCTQVVLVELLSFVKNNLPEVWNSI